MRSMSTRGWLSIPAAVGVVALLGSLATGCACRPGESFCMGDTRFTCEGGGRADGSEDPFGRAVGTDCKVACMEVEDYAFCSASTKPEAACQRLGGTIDSVCWNNDVLLSCTGGYPRATGVRRCGAKVCVEEKSDTGFTIASCKAP